MKFKKVFFLSIGLSFLLGASFYFESINTSTKKELDTNCLVSLKEKDSYSKKEVQESFLNNLKSNIGYNYRIKDTFMNISNIISLKVNSEDIDLISELNEVNYVQIDYEYTLNYSPSDPTYSYLGDNEIIDLNYSLKTMNGINLTTNEGKNTMVAILDSSLNIDHSDFVSLNESEVRYTKSKLEEIYNNNDFNCLEGYKYVSSKLPFVYDYCNNDNDTKSIYTHGTHVSSILGANGNYKGIAPLTQIAFMKVFNDSSSGCTSSVYLKALEDAYLLDVDAINMSFGTILDYSDTETDKIVNEVLTKLKENGTSIFISSGNDGRDTFLGSDYEYSPLENTETGVIGRLGQNESAITVGNAYTDNDETNTYGYSNNREFLISDKIVDFVGNSQDNGVTITNFNNSYTFHSLKDDNNTYNYVYIPNYGKSEDYLNIDCKNKIALVIRGEIPFYVKIYNAILNGCSGLLIYNSSGSETIANFDYTLSEEVISLYPQLPKVKINNKYYFDTSIINIPVGVISYEVGEYLKNGSEDTILFTSREISLSSSNGNLADLKIKPDIVGPGTDVFGALSYDSINKAYLNDAHTFMSGTSMSSPNAAGAYLSILSSNDLSNRTKSRKEILNKLLSNTSLLMDDSLNHISVKLQGNGMVNIKKTLNATSYLTYNNKSKVELYNNSKISNGRIDFSLNLIEEVPQKYDVSVYIYTSKIKTQLINNEYKEVKNNDTYLLEKVDLGSFYTVEGTNTYDDIDITLNSKSLEYLSKFSNGNTIEGYVVFSSLEHELNIPFLGYYGDLTKVKPYEDFSFEKDEDKVYESDLLNSFISSRYGVNKSLVQTGSYILGADNLEDYKLNILNNSYSLTKEFDYLEYNLNTEDNCYHIYTGSYENNNGLLIQLFMTRNAYIGSIYIYNERNELIYETNFKDILNSQYSNELYRNLVLTQSTSLIDEEYYTHRTYAYIPFLDSNKNYIFSDETYLMTFSFNLIDGSIYKSNYKIHFDEVFRDYPEIYDVSLKDNLLRIYIKNTKLEKIFLFSDDISLDINKNNELSYIELNLNEVNYKLDKGNLNYIYLTFINSSNEETYFKYFISENIGLGGIQINEDSLIKYVSRNTKADTLYVYNLNEDLTESYLNFSKDIFYTIKGESPLTSIYAVEGDSSILTSFSNSTSDNELIRFKSKYSYFEISKQINTKDIYKELAPILYSSLIIVIFGVTITITTYLIIRKYNKK